MDLFSSFFEDSGNALLAVELPKGKIIIANKAFERLSCIKRDELIGDFLHLANRFDHENNVRERTLDVKLISHPGLYHDICFTNKGGSVHYLLVKVNHIELAGKKIALINLDDQTEKLQIMRDLTMKHQALESTYIELENTHSELRATQQQMAQAAKLMALGELAAGVSHELNQPLTGIRGYAQEIKDLIKEDHNEEAIDYSKKIIQQVDRMAKLLGQLRNFARHGENKGTDEKIQEVNGQQTMESVLGLFSQQLKSRGVQVKLENMILLKSLSAKPDALEQIFINLVSNSRDAVAVAFEKKNIDEGRIRISAKLIGEEGIEIRFQDNGCGIADAARLRIFDPFFTTKDPNKGMGLGLSLSYNLAKDMNGELQLESSSKSGSTFTLLLKKHRQESRAA